MSPTPRRKLPIGIQNLREIREDGYYYVDKSGLAIDLIESSGNAFVLSRPRRFGKSLLVDTFKELFEGNRALFDGLAAETRWDWSKRHPVIRISFSDGVLQSRAELDQRIFEILHDLALGKRIPSLAPCSAISPRATPTSRFKRGSFKASIDVAYVNSYHADLVGDQP